MRTIQPNSSPRQPTPAALDSIAGGVADPRVLMIGSEVDLAELIVEPQVIPV